MKLFFSLCLIAFGFTAHAQTPSTIQYRTALYQVDFPATWGADTSRKFGTDVIFFTSLADQDDKFSENVTMILQDWKGQNMTLTKYKDVTEKEMRTPGAQRKVLESAIQKKGNDSYYKFTSSFTQEGRQLKSTSICFIKNSIAYLMTYTAEEKNFNSYYPDASKLMNSLVIK